MKDHMSTLVPLLASAIQFGAQTQVPPPVHVPAAVPSVEGVAPSVAPAPTATAGSGDSLSAEDEAGIAAAAAVMDVLGGGPDAVQAVGAHVSELIPALLALSRAAQHSVWYPLRSLCESDVAYS